MIDHYEGPLTDRLFHEDELYAYIEAYAQKKDMSQTLRALPFAKEQHAGQVRKGKEKVPYIYHPLMVASHALALGLDEDTLIAAALLHDVCEDCPVQPEELPVGEAARKIVSLLTKDEHFYRGGESAYYERIAENGAAAVIKLLDRCHNISGMAAGFSEEKMLSYLKETQKWFYPLMDIVQQRYPQYSNLIFTIRYHIFSVLETIRYTFL